jgi:hypothetical protein
MKINPGDTVEFRPANGPRQLAQVLSVNEKKASAMIELAGEDEKDACREARLKRLVLVAKKGTPDDDNR